MTTVLITIAATLSAAYCAYLGLGFLVYLSERLGR
jgi:hypothetical protein